MCAFCFISLEVTLEINALAFIEHACTSGAVPRTSLWVFWRSKHNVIAGTAVFSHLLELKGLKDSFPLNCLQWVHNKHLKFFLRQLSQSIGLILWNREKSYKYRQKQAVKVGIHCEYVPLRLSSWIWEDFVCALIKAFFQCYSSFCINYFQILLVRCLKPERRATRMTQARRCCYPTANVLFEEESK